MTTKELSSLETRIRAVLEERSLLKHPFYQKWTEGTLEKERLQEYARQYYHFEVNFPRFLSAIHTRTDSAEVRQLLLENLWDEEYGPRNHPVLWLQFANALGVSDDEVKNAELRPETAALIDHYRDQAQNAPVAEAMATLFAYEGQVPAIAWEKIKGLKDHYDFAPDEFEFFSVHLVADIGHAGAEVQAIEQLSANEADVVASIEQACDLLNGFLDGCYAVIED